MHSRLHRAQVLFQQSRYELAQQELGRLLTDEPDNASAHALLGVCLAERGQYDEAQRETEAAIHFQPDAPFSHYAHAVVLGRRKRADEAQRAIEEAIRLDPHEADYFSILASSAMQQRRWQQGLDAAEQGLAIDPDHAQCATLRAMALLQLGRHEEAERSLQASLKRAPDDATTHAGQGWTLLERGEPQRALLHFREALRIDPELEWARAGIVEALKARHWFYRVLLRYFFWMDHLSRSAQWMLVLGAWLLFRGLGALGRAQPEWAPLIWPLVGLYLAFAALTWLASPMLNLLLRLNRFGRLALSRQQVTASNWIGGLLVVAATAVLAGVIWPESVAWVTAVCLVVLLLPVAGTFNCQAGWPRTAMMLVTFCLAATAVLAITFIHVGAPLGKTLLMAVVFGSLVSQIAANGLMMAVPKR